MASVRQHTGASAGGWGCTIEQYRSKEVGYCFGLFGPHISGQSSNFRKLLTVYRGLRECRRRPKDADHIQAVANTDNSVSALAIQRRADGKKQEGNWLIAVSRLSPRPIFV
jgi:hypothetical protein